MLLQNMMSLQANAQRVQIPPVFQNTLSLTPLPFLSTTFSAPNLLMGSKLTGQPLLQTNMSPFISIPREQTLKRKLPYISGHTSGQRKHSKLSSSQREKKSVREKKRRQIVANLYNELANKMLSLGVLDKMPQRLQRLGILKTILKVLMPPEEYTNFKSSLDARKTEVNQSLPKRRIKAINEKIRRDTIRYVLDAAAVFIGLEKQMDQAEILTSLLLRMEKHVATKT